MNKYRNLHHFLWRAGFGPSTAELPKWQNLPQKDWWNRMRSDSGAVPKAFDVVDNALKGLTQGIGDVGRMEREQLDKEQRQKMRRQSREDIKSLNLLWLEEMTNSPAQLREKMALFWHGHFASRNLNIFYQQQLLEAIRIHALGNFGDLLRSVSKSAAMLAFLNNQQNKKQHPNENFAREVMELFTLGRGNYTENDIKEAARAFTGWGFRLNGEFVFREFHHDKGAKTVLGKTGNLNGDDVLDLLLAQRQTARFLTQKIYRFFVNDTVAPPPDRVEALATRFFDSGYSIKALLEAIFTAPWFYDAENMGTKIKSPVELWVGIRRALPLRLENPESQLVLQKALGQVLFFPPNVAGWPGGKTWIDSSSLMLRLRLPHLLWQNQALDVRGKDDDDVEMGDRSGQNARRRMSAEINWTAVLNQFRNTPEAELSQAIARQLWQTSKPPDAAVLKRHTDASSRERLIQTTFIQLMAAPEYQLS